MGLRVQGELTELRPVTDGDVEMLLAWHADPEVARYWDGQTYTAEEMRERLARPDVDRYVIEAEAEPVGFIQAWREGNEGGLDMFLVPSARGRGYGPDAARALAAHCSAAGWTRVITDPYTWNEAAVRAWRQAGFEPVEERPPDDDHSSPWLLMEFRV